MPISSKTAAAYWSYAVSIAQRSPRSFFACRWGMRMRRMTSSLRGEPYGDTPPSLASLGVSVMPTSRPRSAVRRLRAASMVAWIVGAFPPAARDRQAAVAPECAQGDLWSRWVLPAFVLGGVDKADDALDHFAVMPGGEQRRATHVALDVVVEDRVELGVVRQRVRFELSGPQLRRRRLGDGAFRNRRRITARGELVAPSCELPYQRLRHILQRREPARAVAVQRGKAGGEFALVTCRQNKMALLVGQCHQRRTANARLQVLSGETMQLHCRFIGIDHRSDIHNAEVDALSPRQILRVGDRVVAGVTTRQSDGVHRLGSQRVHSDGRRQRGVDAT